MDELLDGGIETAAMALRTGAVSVRALTAAALARIDRQDGAFDAFFEIERDAALVRAEALDRARCDGAALGPLYGIPVARKDMFDRAGCIVSCGAARWSQRRAERTATCLARLDAAGAVDLGRTSMSEYAFHPHGLNQLRGPARNPWDAARVAGGSSGGAAAALAAGFVFGAIGSDSGGSIRHPASLCGIVGLLPTRGRLSRHGMMRSSPSLDAAGPMARNVRDCAALFAAVAGPDPADPDTATRPYRAEAVQWTRALSGRRIARPKDVLLDSLAPEARDTFEAAVETLRREGAEIRFTDLPEWDALNAITAIVFATEVAATHRHDLAAAADFFSPEVRERMAAGFAYDGIDYLDALRLRGRLTRHFVAASIGDADALILPSATDVAPRLDEVMPGADRARYDAGAHTLATPADPGRFTRVFNYLGLPALALPAGLSAAKLPLGIQIAGRPFAEATLFEIGDTFERATGFARRKI
ncbi:MAG: amidase [Rhodospirillaceae bacterium]|nr:amidase [Rhodospirillaceae bacterium]